MADQLKNTANAIIQNWRRDGKNLSLDNIQLRNAILDHPRIQAALVNHLNRLDLQGQINAGKIDENQALKLFHDAGIEFIRKLNTIVNNAMTGARTNLDPNQINWSDPVAVQNQMNIPGTLANNTMSEAAQLIETANVQDQVQVVQQDNAAINQAQQADQQMQAAATTSSSGDLMRDTEKGVVVAAALKIIERIDPKFEEKEIKEAEKLLEDAFHKVTGVEGGKIEELAKDLTGKAEDETKTAFPSLKPDMAALEKDIDKK